MQVEICEKITLQNHKALRDWQAKIAPTVIAAAKEFNGDNLRKSESMEIETFGEFLSMPDDVVEARQLAQISFRVRKVDKIVASYSICLFSAEGVLAPTILLKSYGQEKKHFLKEAIGQCSDSILRRAILEIAALGYPATYRDVG